MIRDAASFAIGYRIGLALKEHTIIEQEKEGPWLTFSSPEPFTLAVYNATKNWDGTLEYSTDTTTWTVWDGTTTLTSGAGNKVCLRGTGNTRITYIGKSARWVCNGQSISCTGDIRTLLDYSDPQNTSMQESCYNSMFYGCTSLVSAPELPATTLADGCYDSMFYGCTSLASAPELPATTLAAYCYFNMFGKCTSLVSAPELPATKLAGSCYYRMFADCTSLVSAPALSAATLPGSCYSYMFYGCTSLLILPIIKAATLNSYSCSYMFYGCTRIKISEQESTEYYNTYKLPTSPVSIIWFGNKCFDNMFTNTGGLFTGSPPQQATTYYTANEVI